MSQELLKVAKNGQWSLEKGDVRTLRTFHFTPGGHSKDGDPIYNFFRIQPNGQLSTERSGQVSLNSKTGNIYPLTPTMHPDEYDNFFGSLEDGRGPHSAQLEREVLKYHTTVGQRLNPAPPKTQSPSNNTIKQPRLSIVRNE